MSTLLMLPTLWPLWICTSVFPFETPEIGHHSRQSETSLNMWNEGWGEGIESPAGIFKDLTAVQATYQEDGCPVAVPTRFARGRGVLLWGPEGGRASCAE